ncbi:hypothetical protein THOB06_40219 [Vibrio rotiferianus]|nr:hypothetical protein THOG10_40220 [Vibrio rotiferianus]CAH1589438.1 hypothetical protein THOB06_40219 [Vibrio rotiferianus]
MGWLQQEVERAVWLSRALAIRDSNVSSETVVRWEIKPEKLQRSSWRNFYAMVKALNKLTELGMLETQYIA